MVISITGKDNKTLKLVRALHRKKGRVDNGLYFAEGMRLVGEAVKYRFSDIEFVIASEDFAEKNPDFINSLDLKGKIVYTSKGNLFKEMCDTENPQGIGVVLKIPGENEPEFSKIKFILILDGVSEPGNLGTIIRTAEAAGVDAVVLTKGCVDLYNPKVVRSTMGSLFRMKCITNADIKIINNIKNSGFSLISTALNNSVEIAEAKYINKKALVIGSEADGVSDEILSISDICVRIPMCGEVESLNAAVAAGIAMYMLKSREV